MGWDGMDVYYVCMRMCMYVYLCIYVCMYVCMYVSIYIYMRATALADRSRELEDRAPIQTRSPKP